ncbi:hypothetical protein ACFQS6_07645 [Xanthomonas populi]
MTFVQARRSRIASAIAHTSLHVAFCYRKSTNALHFAIAMYIDAKRATVSMCSVEIATQQRHSIMETPHPLQRCCAECEPRIAMWIAWWCFTTAISGACSTITETSFTAPTK